jgi:hypothetical protein
MPSIGGPTVTRCTFIGEPTFRRCAFKVTEANDSMSTTRVIALIFIETTSSG